jgi:hypothetical protein
MDRNWFDGSGGDLFLAQQYTFAAVWLSVHH